ncbi:hypothetical protein SRHO_G00006840 [Serrasalmus rhombeus]
MAGRWGRDIVQLAKEIITGTSKVLLNKADVFEAIQETNTQQPGFPPDILHDLLEGVIPVELALCLKGLLNAIEMATQLKLRVILDDENAEKLILPSRPETVNDLIFEVKNKLELTYDIRLQFQDPDFDNALCNLVNMEDLPSKATIKIVRLVEYDLSSTSTDETVMLSDNTDSPDRLSRWPEVFVVPTFSYEVEYTLKEGNCTFEKEGKSLILTRDQKHNILEGMAAEIYKLKAYPSGEQIRKVSEALVTKHPCLRERGSKTGYDGWKNSLCFKMGNYRTKLSRAGVKDVAVNAGKRSKSSPEASASRSSIKRPRRGEVNFLPNYPSGENKDTLETLRLAMVEEFKKTTAERNMILIHQHMQRTFALRREEIVNSTSPIADLKERWPALFGEAQDKNDISAARVAALAGLPLYLKEDSSAVFKNCKEEEFEEFHKGPVALVAVVDEDNVPSVIPFQPLSVSVILEDQVVMSHRSWADALGSLVPGNQHQLEHEHRYFVGGKEVLYGWCLTSSCHTHLYTHTLKAQFRMAQVCRTALTLDAPNARNLKEGINFTKSPDGQCFVIYKHQYTIKACRNQCKHQGGRFIKDIEDMDGRTVRCTKHYWKLNVANMQYVNPPDSFLQDELEVVQSVDGGLKLLELDPPDPWDTDPRPAQELQPGEITTV